MFFSYSYEYYQASLCVFLYTHVLSVIWGEWVPVLMYWAIVFVGFKCCIAPLLVDALIMSSHVHYYLL